MNISFQRTVPPGPTSPMPLRGKKSGSLAKVGVDEKQSPMPEDSTIELVVKSPQQTPMPFVETLDETNESLSKTGKLSARRRRAARQKACRDCVCGTWILLLTAFLGFLGYSYYHQVSNSDLQAQILKLNAQLYNITTPLSNRVTTLDKNLQAAVVQVGDTLDGVNTRLEAAEIRITNLTSLTDTLQNTVNDLTTQLDDTDITVNSLVSETTNHAHRITILEADSAEALNQTAGLAAAANTTIAATNTLKQDVYQIFSILTTLSNDDTASKRQLANLTTRMVWAESNYTSLNNFTTWMYNLLIPVSQNLTATTAVANSAALLSQNLLTRVVVLEATASFTSDSLNGTRSALFPTGVSKQLDAHSAAVSAIVATRPDGYIVSASADITMRTWDVRTGLLLYTITSNINQGGGHSNPVNALAVLHNGLLVSGASEPIAIVWNFTVPSLPVKLSTFTASSGSVYTLSATVDGGSVISGGSDHSVKIWSVNANTGAATLTTSFIGHANSVNCLAVRVDGSVMSGDQSGVLNIWNTASPSGPALTTSITAASPRSPGVNALVDLPAAGIWPERVAAAYSDFHIRIWDAHNLTLYVTMSGHTDVVYTLCLLADRSLVSGSADGTMKVWDSSHGLLWNSVTSGTPVTGAVNVVTRLEDGTVITGTADKHVYTWRQGTDQPSIFV